MLPLNTSQLTANSQNAEINLGTVHDLQSAKQWLKGTFLYTRLSQNPDHYRLDGDASGLNLEDRIERICERDISLLQDTNLVSLHGRLKSTEFGDAMARCYIKFETMKHILSLEPGAKLSEIVRKFLVPGHACTDITSYQRYARPRNSTKFAFGLEKRAFIRFSIQQMALSFQYKLVLI